MVKSDPEPEIFRPNLNEPSVLLQPEQIEKASIFTANLSGSRVGPYLSVHLIYIQLSKAQTSQSIQCLY